MSLDTLWAQHTPEGLHVLEVLSARQKGKGGIAGDSWVTGLVSWYTGYALLFRVYRLFVIDQNIYFVKEMLLGLVIVWIK